MTDRACATWVLLRGLTRESGHWGDFPQAFQSPFPGPPSPLLSRTDILRSVCPGGIGGTSPGLDSDATVEAIEKVEFVQTDHGIAVIETVGLAEPEPEPELGSEPEPDAEPWPVWPVAGSVAVIPSTTMVTTAGPTALTMSTTEVPPVLLATVPAGRTAGVVGVWLVALMAA